MKEGNIPQLLLPPQLMIHIRGRHGQPSQREKFQLLEAQLPCRAANILNHFTFHWLSDKGLVGDLLSQPRSFYYFFFFTSALGHASLRSSLLPRQWQIQCQGHKTGTSSEGWTPKKSHHVHFHAYKAFRLSPSSYTNHINSRLHGVSA